MGAHWGQSRRSIIPAPFLLSALSPSVKQPLPDTPILCVLPKLARSSKRGLSILKPRLNCSFFIYVLQVRAYKDKEMISVLFKVLMKLIKMLSQIKYSINIFYHVNLFSNIDLIKIVLKASDFYEYFYFLQVQLFPKVILESIVLQF